jgi:nitrite reductase (NO-forming)
MDARTSFAHGGTTVTRLIVVVSSIASVLLLSLILARVSPVTGETAGAQPSASASHDMGAMPSPGATTAVAEDPSAPDYVLRDPKAPSLVKGTVHDIDLYVVEQKMTVAKGFVQTVYAFGLTPETATVPGPVLRVKVGDTLRIHFKNPKTNMMPHSVDFHASLVAWNDEMADINPGEEKLYEFKAQYAGVFMYHCGTAGALSHMLNGMYGMIIVEPREGLSKVDQEFFVVQSEWYLGQQGQTGDLAKANATVPNPDFVVFNGVATQYKDNPIPVKTGENIRVFVLNAGPSEDSSFHVVGTIFDSVTKEGIHLARGNDGNWGSQAVDLSPAQGAIVEFHFDEDGLYPFVTHAFNYVAHGAIGLFQAGDGDPTN